MSSSLDETHHHKDSMTDFAIPGSASFVLCEDLRLQSFPSSKWLEKAKFVHAEEERQTFLAAKYSKKLRCRCSLS